MLPAPRQYGPATRRPATVRPGNAPSSLALRLAPVQAEVVEAVPQARDAKLARLEATLMFADEPLTIRKLVEAASLKDSAEARKQIQHLNDFYEQDGSAFHVVEIAGGVQLLTRAVFHPWLLRLRRTGQDVRLTPAALETLAVIAYRQPVTRADVELVRGVSCTEIIRLLMEKGLVRVGGRHDSLGRPQLYSTTKKFLQIYGLNTLSDLPEVESLPKPK